MPIGGKRERDAKGIAVAGLHQSQRTATGSQAASRSLERPTV